MAMPNAACPGLYRKPLDAAIGQLLTPYCPGGRQGHNKNDNAQCTYFADPFDGCGGATKLYRAHCPMKEVQGFHKSQ